MSKILVDEIYESIQEAIISNKLLPGQRLHIAQLADQYHVGPGPVREALSRLLATELVVAISQKGFRVATVSKVDLNDIYQTRFHTECIALRLSIENGDDRWEGDIVAAFHRLAKFEAEIKNHSTENYKEWESRHRIFNLALIKDCGLAHLLRIQSKLYNLTERYRRQWLVAGMEQMNGIPYARSQKKIMEAALSRDIDKAEKLLREHYERAVKVIESYFTEHHLFEVVN